MTAFLLLSLFDSTLYFKFSFSYLRGARFCVASRYVCGRFMRPLLCEKTGILYLEIH